MPDSTSHSYAIMTFLAAFERYNILPSGLQAIPVSEPSVCCLTVFLSDSIMYSTPFFVTGKTKEKKEKKSSDPSYTENRTKFSVIDYTFYYAILNLNKKKNDYLLYNEVYFLHSLYAFS